MPEKSLAREIALVGVMAALSNVIALVALPGPLNIQFGFTAIPILLVSFSLGGPWGFLCGLFGGIVQAQKYGHILYILYTAIQGGVAGFFATRSAALTRRIAPIFALIGGFFMTWWIDILRSTHFSLNQLGTTSFADAPRVFGKTFTVAPPIAACIVAVILLGATFWFIRSRPRDSSTVHLALAGCFGAIAYIPYDAVVLYGVQGYPWLPTWFVLSKDLIQDLLAAILCALLYQNRRIRNLLLASSAADF